MFMSLELKSPELIKLLFKQKLSSPKLFLQSRSYTFRKIHKIVGQVETVA
jgi:hypothetical protein